MIFFRDQLISPGQHLGFGRLFGDLHVHPAAPHVTGMPELMTIHTDRNSPRANGEGWHSDVSCDPEPPMGSHPLYQGMPAHWRRYPVRQHVCRLRGPIGPAEGLSGRSDRGARRRACLPRDCSPIWANRIGRPIRARSTLSCAPTR